MPEVTEVRRREITQEEQEVSVETIGAKCGVSNKCIKCKFPPLPAQKMNVNV